MSEPASKDLLERLWWNEHWCDLEITTQGGAGDVYKVHKAIVCEQSNYLAERYAAEGSDICVGEDTEIVLPILRHIYGRQPEYYLEEMPFSGQLDVMEVVGMLTAASKYGLPKLRVQIENSVLDWLPHFNIRSIVHAAQSVSEEDSKNFMAQNILDLLIKRTLQDIDLVMSNGGLWDMLKKNNWYLKAVMKNLAEDRNKVNQKQDVRDMSTQTATSND